MRQPSTQSGYSTDMVTQLLRTRRFAVLAAAIATVLLLAEPTPADDTSRDALNAESVADQQEAAPAEDAVRMSVAKAVPFLKAEGVGWMKKRGCVSCHQIPTMLWSLSTAFDRGFDVREDELRQWKSWSTDVVNFVKPADKKSVDRDKTMSGNIDTMNGLLLAIQGDREAAWRETFAAALVANKNEDGSWQACGQLPMQKRPSQETTRVTVAWTLLALADQGFPWPPESLAFVDAGQPAISTEWWATRLLLADAAGDAANTAQFGTRLMELQREDGGWGWLTADDSDALGTGLAICALERAAIEHRGAAIQQATKFLTTTQESDGSWRVKGTKKSTRNKHTETSDYWGTAWAVIGLLESHSSVRGGE